MKRSLIFDIGGVLIFFDNATLLRNLRSLMANPPPADQLLREIRASGIGTGHLSVADLYRTLQDRYCITGPYTAFMNAWCSHFMPNEKLLASLKSLSASWNISICSNTNDGHWNFLDAQYGLRKRVSEVVLSFKYGIEKPDSKLFEIVKNRCARNCEKAIFVDDDKANVAAATAAGFTGMLFQDADELLLALEAID